MDYVNDYLKNKCSLAETYANLSNEITREADQCYDDTEKYDRLVKQKEQLQGIIATEFMKEHGYHFHEGEPYTTWHKID